MALDAATIQRASGALRAYSGAGQLKDRDEAHAALSQLILTAMSEGNNSAEELLREVRELLWTGLVAANDADNLLATLPLR